jgi:hypothetical protein
LKALYVIQVGSVYDAVDPQTAGGEWSQRLVLDSTFAVLGPYLY